MFPELEATLLELYDPGELGNNYIIRRYRGTRTNLRTHLARIIKRAGLAPWPRPWHNMRATRETELCEDFPLHVVTAWLGNSARVAQAHYFQVTDAHFAQAVGDPKAAAAATAAPEQTPDPAQIPAQESSPPCRGTNSGTAGA